MSGSSVIEIVSVMYPDVQAIYFFGSHGTIDEIPGSDIDIAILLPHETAKASGNISMSRCRFALEEAVGGTVDLVNLRLVPTVFQHEIVNSGRIIHMVDAYAVAEFEMLTLSMYQKLNEERRHILEDIRKSGRVLAA